MTRAELFTLADYIVAHYGDVVTVVRFIYDPEEDRFAIVLRMPDDSDEIISTREDWDVGYEPEVAAWRDWIERHSTAPSPPPTTG